MKQEIDLTSNRMFRDGRTERKSYKHKVLPWYREDDESKPAVLKKTERKVDKSAMISTFRSFNTWITSDFIMDVENELIGTISYNNINGTSTTSSINFTRFNDYISDYFTTYSYDDYTCNYSTVSSTNLSSNSINVITKGKSINHGFCCGSAKEIREYREGLLKQEEEKRKKTQNEKRRVCQKCGKEFYVFPWTYTRSYSYNVLCDECYTMKNKPDVKNSFYNKFIKDSTVTVPCLSSDIEQVPLRRCFYGISRRCRNVIREYYNVYESSKLRNSRSQSIWGSRYTSKPMSVYVKNHTLKGRSQPWQPKGRVRQEYDRIFESLNWRSMLANYVRKK